MAQGETGDAREGLRPVARVLPSHNTLEGGGFPVRRPFPVAGVDQVDPFLLLDELGPVEWPPGGAIGAPDHPHRGFETVTYLLEGAVEHRDSRGHVATIEAGGMQWMTAGGGVIHSELPTEAFQRRGGRMHGFQIWVNLPRALKRTEPRYQDVPASALPAWRREDGAVVVRVLAGRAQGLEAQAETHTPITLLHLSLAAGAEHRLELPPGERICVYLFVGAARFSPGADLENEGAFVVFGSGEAILVEAGDEPVELLVLGAVPLNEPMVRHGPFVMNTREEILEAFEDYQAGRLA